MSSLPGPYTLSKFTKYTPPYNDKQTEIENYVCVYVLSEYVCKHFINMRAWNLMSEKKL